MSTSQEKKIYIVQPGDTVSEIAQKHNTTRAELLRLNKELRGNPNVLQPKQKLTLPSNKKAPLVATTRKATNTLKEEISEQEWKNKISASLKGKTPFKTQLGIFDLNKEFISGEKNNVPIIKKAFDNYMKTSGKQFSADQKKYMLAYILATAKHETADFTTLEEKTDGKKYNPPARVAKILGNEMGDGPIYIGRGYSQLTGENNYENWSEKFFGKGNKTILTKYRSILLLNPEISATILVKGMMEGAFTGRGLRRYLGKETLDFENARRTVNGIDGHTIIAKYAHDYLEIL